MNISDAKAAAKSTGCKLIDQNITLTELNQILLAPDPSCEKFTGERLFADFSLGRKLNIVLVVGTQQCLRDLHLKIYECQKSFHI